jgi:DNA-binding protein H-NS
MPRRSYEAIRKQIEKLEAQARKLEEAAEQKKKQAVAQVVALMKKLGVSLDDMTGAKPRRTRAAKGAAKKRAAKKRGAKKGGPRKPVAPKFRNGKTGETWSGRGRTPRWLAALESQGKSRDDYRV